MIREQGANEYDFSHDRIRETAYAELSPIRRRWLHQRAARALETVYASNTNAVSGNAVSGQLALHYERAGMLPQAVNWYQRAGQVAWNLHALHDAMHDWRYAIKLLSQLPATKANLAQELTLQIEFDLSMSMSTGSMRTERRDALLRARELAIELRDMDRLVEALIRLSGVHIARGNAPKGHFYINEAISVLEQVENAKRKADVYIAHAWALLHKGDFEQAKTSYVNGLKLLKPAFESSQEPSIQWARVVSGMATILWVTGFPRQAWELTQSHRSYRDQALEPLRRASPLYQAAILCCNLGYDSILAEEAEQLIKLGEQYDLVLARQSSAIFDGWLLAKEGHLQQGIALTRQGIDGFRQMGHITYQTHRLATFSEMLLWSKQLGEVEQVLEEAFDISEHYAQHIWDAELHRLQGDLLLAQDAPDGQAEIAYMHAIKIAQQQSAKSLELRACTSLCRLWQRQGKRSEAHDLLAEIYGWFSEGFDTPDLQEAKALLETLS